MDKTNNRMKALLTAAALGVCCAYAQTAPPGGFVLPDADPDAAPYGFQMSKTDDGMSVSLTLNRIDRTVTDSVAEACRVSVPGLSSTTFAGLPALPYKTFRIAPEGSATPQIIVRDSTYIDIPVNLDHNPRIEYDSIGQPRQIAVACVDYSGFMPSDLARVTDTQTYRDCPIYTVTVMPMKYDRAAGVLRVFTSLDIDIAYTVQAQTQSADVTRSAAFNAYTDRMLTETLGEEAVAFSTDRQVATMGIIGDKIGEMEPATEIDLYDTTEDMLVLSCTPDFHEATDSLTEWKKNLGYRVHVIERNWDWTREIVDATIKHYYNTLPNLTTVIIIGTNNTIPGYSVKERFPKTYLPSDDAPTDYPYMCLDGSGDRFPDVAYGRILASCGQQANDYVAKLIKYERGLFSDSSVYGRAFLSSKYWWDDFNVRFIQTLEEIHDILDHYDINAQRIYTTDSGKSPTHYDDYGRNPMPEYLLKPNYPWNATKEDIINAFQSNVNLAIYNGHGGSDCWGGFEFRYEDCSRLTFTNSAPLIFSIACSTANHNYINCISAELSRRTSGGIAVIASAHSTFLPNSDALLLGMVDAIWPNAYTYNGWSDPVSHKPIYRLYDILAAGHNRVEIAQGGGFWDNSEWIEGKPNTYLRFQRENFHVYGDPTVNYNTKVPSAYNASCLVSPSNHLTVNISNADLPAKLVVKNLRDGSIRTHQITETSSLDEYQFALSQNDSIEVIISGPNKIPYREIVTGSTEQPLLKGRINSVTYDRSTQTAVVSYALNNSGDFPSFTVTDINNTSHTPLIAIGPGTNQRTLYLDSVPTGLCVISMLINGEVVSTYKLLKQ